MLDIKRHRQVLFDLVSDIYRSPVGSLLGFKGGTMAHFFYGLDRFSVDLDFDLLDEKVKDEVRDSIHSILLRHGSIRDDSDKRYTLFFLLSYEKGLHTIKVEISKRMTEGARYEVANFYGTDVKVLSRQDSFATKLLACTRRKKTAYRDFYDVYFYLKKGIQPNDKLIETETKKSFSQYIAYLMRFIEKNISSRNILHGLGELVDEKQKVWIKNNLKEELVRRLNFLRDEVV